jgi:hypothetical protein
VAIGTATPITLALDTLSDIVWGTKKATSTVALGSATSGVLYTAQNLNSQQTFTSNDLGAYGQSTYSATQPTGLAAVLANMRAALEWALSVLKPFRGFTGTAQ